MRKAKNREYKVRMRVCSSFKLKYWVSQPRHWEQCAALWQSGDSLDSVRQSSGRPYLLCVIDKSDANYSSALAVVNRLSALINTYTITQLQRGQGSSLEWPRQRLSNGCLTNCLHLFRSVSVTSVRILVAEVSSLMNYLHKNNFNFPNLTPKPFIFPTNRTWFLTERVRIIRLWMAQWLRVRLTVCMHNGCNNENKRPNSIR